jgi:hypothetical protein
MAPFTLAHIKSSLGEHFFDFANFFRHDKSILADRSNLTIIYSTTIDPCRPNYDLSDYQMD